MSGIIIIFVIVIWTVIAFLMSKALTAIFIKTPWKADVVFFCLFIPLLILPIIDDVLIGREFKKLCKEYSATQMDRESIRGKTIYTGKVIRTEIKRGIMKAFVEKWEYLDIKTNEVVISHREITTKGGFLSSFAPDVLRTLTFKGTCSPDGRRFNEEVFKELDIIQIDNKDLDSWRKKNADN